MTELEDIASLLEAQSGIQGLAVDDQGVLVVPTAICGVDASMLIRREHGLLHFDQIVPAGLEASPEALALAVCRMNAGHQVPGLVYDQDYGVVLFRFVVPLDDGGVSPAVVQRVLATCIETAELAFAALEALPAAESPRLGRDSPGLGAASFRLADVPMRDE